MQSSEIAQDCIKTFAIWTEGIFNILLVVSLERPGSKVIKTKQATIYDFYLV